METVTNDKRSQKMRYNVIHVLPPVAFPSVIYRLLCACVTEIDAIAFICKCVNNNNNYVVSCMYNSLAW